MQAPRSIALSLFALLLSVGNSTNALAQPGCDQLEVISLRYAPFSDTTMQVMARALPGTLFSSPYFNLFDAAGDTVAAGHQWFFGMTSVAQSHTLNLDEGEPPPQTPFTGTLEFNYMTMEGQAQCLLPMTNVDLCDIATCDTVNPFAYRTGPGDPVTTSLDWHLTNEEGSTIASGVFQLDALDQQIDHAEVCAVPGNYTLHVSQSEAIGSSYAFGVTLGGEYFTVNGPIEELSPDGQASLDFMFYPACVDIGESIVERTSAALTLHMQGRMLMVRSNNDGPIGAVRITDSMGRVVVEKTISGSTSHLDLSSVASGTYIMHAAGFPTHVQRFIIH